MITAWVQDGAGYFPLRADVATTNGAIMVTLDVDDVSRETSTEGGSDGS